MIRRRHGRDRGQATVEVALLLPVVVVLVLVLLQLGVVARDVVLVTHSAREAARAAAVDDEPDAALDAARAAGRLDPDRLSVTVRGRKGPGSRVHVEVRYTIATSVPIVGALMRDVVVTSGATMRVEGDGTTDSARLGRSGALHSATSRDGARRGRITPSLRRSVVSTVSRG